jgi:uncharacterized protein with PIN domain
MLGKLATYLRMCGHDTASALDRGVECDDELAGLAREENRTLLTRDTALACRVEDAIRLEGRDVLDQLSELDTADVDISLSERPQRCGACNGPVVRVSGDTSTPQYAPDPVSEPVWRCRACGQHFWKGSHWKDVRSRLTKLTSD